MADIFLAVQRGEDSFERFVVIKRIRSGFLSDPSAEKSFLDEARTVAYLNHPNIVKIFDVYKMGDEPCIVMEYIDGEHLNYLRKFANKQQQRVPVNITCKLIFDACQALEYAHHATGPDGRELRIIHRDVSPQNLMVDSSGNLKIIDFGIAKSTAQTELTAPAMIKGKIAYLSPDVLQHKTVDGRSDVYSLGVVFYELLTQRRAINTRDMTTAEILQRIVGGEGPLPAPGEVEIETALEAVVRRACATNRDDRYQNAEDMGIAISDAANKIGGMATSAEVRRWFRASFEERLAERRNFERSALARAAARFRAQTAAEPQQSVTTAVDEVPRPASPPPAPNESTGELVVTGEIATHERLGHRHRRHNPYAISLFVFALTLLGGFIYHRVLNQQTPVGETGRHPLAAVAIPEPKTTPARAMIYLVTFPDGATLFVDGVDSGRTSANGLVTPVSAGVGHKLRIVMDGFEPEEHSLAALERGSEHRLVIKLSAIIDEPAASPKNEAKTLAVDAIQERDTVDAKPKDIVRPEIAKPTPKKTVGAAKAKRPRRLRVSKPRKVTSTTPPKKEAALVASSPPPPPPKTSVQPSPKHLPVPVAMPVAEAEAFELTPLDSDKSATVDRPNAAGSSEPTTKNHGQSVAGTGKTIIVSASNPATVKPDSSKTIPIAEKTPKTMTRAERRAARLARRAARQAGTDGGAQTQITVSKWLSGAGDWSGADVLARGCGRCHREAGEAKPLQPLDKTAAKWRAFFQTRGHYKHGRLDQLFSRGEQERVQRRLVSGAKAE